MNEGRRILSLFSGRRAAPEWTEASKLSQDLAAGDRLTVVDVRGAAEFSGPLGHIPGARNLPIDSLVERSGELAGLENEAVVLVCLTDKRSTAAVEVLRAAGFAKLSVLRGGMEQWHREGFAVEGQSTPTGQGGPQT